MITVKLPIKPVSVNQAFRSIPRGKYCASIKSAQYRQFEEDALKVLPKKKMIEGEVDVTLEFHLKRCSTTDIDNMAKTTLDVINAAGYIEDDRYIYDLHLHKYRSNEDWINIVITEH